MTNKLILLSICFIVGACSSNGKNLTISGSSSATGTATKLSGREIVTISGSPTSFKVTMYSLYISENEDCSSPIQVADFGSSGEEFDLYTNPTLISADVAEGTYNCLIIEFSDVMKFKADQTAVDDHLGCLDTTTENSFDVYRDGDTDDEQWIDLNGDPIDATGSAATPGSDRAFSFSSVAADQSVVQAGGQLAHQHQKGILTSPLVVPGQTTLYIDAANSLTSHNEGPDDYCWVEQIETGFR